MPRNKLSAILFDFDGTLTKPGLLNFAEIRAALRCPPNETILEYISSLPDEPRQEANQILEGFEMKAACEATPNRGAEALVEFLKSRRLPFGIITRNRLSMVLRSLENFAPRIRPDDFSVILSRDEIFAPKPDPEGIRVAAAKMGVPVEEVLVVGDFRYDIQAGERAGATTVLLTNGDPMDQAGCSPDFRLADLHELKPVIRRLFPLEAGKVPNDLLEAVLGDIRPADPTVLVAPAIGQDAAAVLLPAGEGVLILKSDPITFATSEQSFYAVVVNANDVVAMGAIPRWFLATLLLPPGSTAEQAGDEIRKLHRACTDLGISLVGGHTEVTPAVNQPVVVGCLAGTVTRDGLLRKEDASEGDCLLLTKGVAVEGTSILAREYRLELAALGVTQELLEKCRKFLFKPGISVVPEGRIAIESHLAIAMHDVTEGGLATALEELSRASGQRIRLFAEQIPVFPETEQLCGLLGLKPLGLIGSGNLLIVCRSDKAEELQGLIGKAGIQVTAIGEIREPGFGLEAIDEDGQPVAWPHFEVDEITRAKAAIEAALAERL